MYTGCYSLKLPVAASYFACPWWRCCSWPRCLFSPHQQCARCTVCLVMIGVRYILECCTRQSHLTLTYIALHQLAHTLHPDIFTDFTCPVLKNVHCIPSRRQRWTERGILVPGSITLGLPSYTPCQVLHAMLPFHHRPPFAAPLFWLTSSANRSRCQQHTPLLGRSEQCHRSSMRQLHQPCSPPQHLLNYTCRCVVGSIYHYGEYAFLCCSLLTSHSYIGLKLAQQ